MESNVSAPFSGLSRNISCFHKDVLKYGYAKLWNSKWNRISFNQTISIFSYNKWIHTELPALNFQRGHVNINVLLLQKQQPLNPTTQIVKHNKGKITPNQSAYPIALLLCFHRYQPTKHASFAFINMQRTHYSLRNVRKCQKEKKEKIRSVHWHLRPLLPGFYSDDCLLFRTHL